MNQNGATQVACKFYLAGVVNVTMMAGIARDHLETPKDRATSAQTVAVCYDDNAVRNDAIQQMFLIGRTSIRKNGQMLPPFSPSPRCARRGPATRTARRKLVSPGRLRTGTMDDHRHRPCAAFRHRHQRAIGALLHGLMEGAAESGLPSSGASPPRPQCSRRSWMRASPQERRGIIARLLASESKMTIENFDSTLGMGLSGRRDADSRWHMPTGDRRL